MVSSRSRRCRRRPWPRGLQPGCHAPRPGGPGFRLRHRRRGPPAAREQARSGHQQRGPAARQSPTFKRSRGDAGAQGCARRGPGPRARRDGHRPALPLTTAPRPGARRFRRRARGVAWLSSRAGFRQIASRYSAQPRLSTMKGSPGELERLLDQAWPRAGAISIGQRVAEGVVAVVVVRLDRRSRLRSRSSI